MISKPTTAVTLDDVTRTSDRTEASKEAPPPPPVFVDLESQLCTNQNAVGKISQYFIQLQGGVLFLTGSL